MLHKNALKAYTTVEQDCRVEGADRHQLVEILFTELIGSLDRALLAITTGDRVVRSRAQTKALTIIVALAGSLDFERGEPVATTLAKIYEWARRELIAANKDKPAERIKEVRRCMADIAEAWSMIGKKSSKAA